MWEIVVRVCDCSLRGEQRNGTTCFLHMLAVLYLFLIHLHVLNCRKWYCMQLPLSFCLKDGNAARQCMTFLPDSVFLHILCRYCNLWYIIMLISMYFQSLFLSFCMLTGWRKRKPGQTPHHGNHPPLATKMATYHGSATPNTTTIIVNTFFLYTWPSRCSICQG